MVFVPSVVETERYVKLQSRGWEWGPFSPVCVCLLVLQALSQMILWLFQVSAGRKSDKSLLAKWRAVIWKGALKCPDI